MRAAIASLSAPLKAAAIRSPAAISRSAALRTLSTTPQRCFSQGYRCNDRKKPLASTKDGIEIPYPEQNLEGVGHSTTGGRVGPHTQRTLASFSMEGKVCVVTGAARGLGNLIARTFVESGANQVAILDLNPEECKKAAADVDAWFTEHGQVKPGELDIAGYGCNIANEEEVASVMSQVRERYGRIDVVVNSAGIVENFPATEYPTDKVRKLFDININGSWYVAREAAKHMLNDGTKGSIILIASMSAAIANVPQPQTPYNASKAAVKHMASSLAVEWAKNGIRVNSLSPGYMLTSLTKAVLENSPSGKELKRTWENLTPMGRMGNPEDLKGAIIYLASDASAFTTGSDLIVDGGYTAI